MIFAFLIKPGYIKPETKEQSNKWVFRGDSTPQKAEATLSSNKGMSTLFLEICVIIISTYRTVSTMP